ncbi:MAG: ABC transporter permease, partial [Rhizobacter sp.]|nr:ABC transporter permease [Rhizobacter sp.]
MPKPVLLWTDAVLYLMVVALAWAVWRIRVNENLRANWTKVLRDPAALCAGIVLALFALVTLADSVHFRRALPPAAGAPADAPV